MSKKKQASISVIWTKETGDGFLSPDSTFFNTKGDREPSPVSFHSTDFSDSIISILRTLKNMIALTASEKTSVSKNALR